MAVATGTSPNNRLVLDAGWSSVTRSGRWDIPPFLLLNGAKSTLKVDCLQATPIAGVIDIQVVASMGVVKIVIPQSWAANTDRLVPSWGSAKSKVSAKPDPGAPLLVLLGWGRLGPADAGVPLPGIEAGKPVTEQGGLGEARRCRHKSQPMARIKSGIESFGDLGRVTSCGRRAGTNNLVARTAVDAISG